MNRSIDPEEAAALSVLDRFGRQGGPDETAVPQTDDEVEVVLRRLFEETATLMAYGLPPAEPALRVRQRLLAQVVGDETQDVTALLSSAEPTSSTTAPESAAADDSRAVLPFEPLRTSAAAARERPSAWRPGRGFGLAAVFALLALGLGLWSAYLVSELRASEARLAWAETEWKGDAASLREDLNLLRERFENVTAAAVTVYPLRCPTGHGPAANARAYLYVRPDRKAWEFAVHGLAPEPEGRDYQAWFLVDGEPRSAGCFRIRDGRAVFELPERLPERLNGVAVSIEPRGGSRRPTTPPILVAESSIRL